MLLKIRYVLGVASTSQLAGTQPICAQCRTLQVFGVEQHQQPQQRLADSAGSRTPPSGGFGFDYFPSGLSQGAGGGTDSEVGSLFPPP